MSAFCAAAVPHTGFPLDQILERVARKQFVLQAEVQAEAAAGALAAAGGIAGCAATATASGLLSPAGPPPLVDLSPQQPALPMRDTLLLCDFDKTLIDFDACERLIEDLAPELLPAMVSLEEPACFVPITNSILGEVCRRGMGREALVAALQRLGAEVPPASLQLLRLAKQRQGVDVRILSDCNSVFIHHILQAVNALPLVDEVITNAAHFVRVGGEDGGTVSMPVELGAAKAAASLDIRSARQGGSSSNGGDAAAAPCGSQHKLVIQPLHAGPQPHGCPRCPSNLCKGAQVRKLRGRQPYRRIVYCGDGANDICAALHLGPGDVVLARQGYALAQFLTQQQAQRPQAPFRLWATHQELLTLVQQQLLAAP